MAFRGKAGRWERPDPRSWAACSMWDQDTWASAMACPAMYCWLSRQSNSTVYTNDDESPCLVRRRAIRKEPRMKPQRVALPCACLVFLFYAFSGLAQEKVAATPALQGQSLFIENCSNCHRNANEAPKAPSQQTLMQMTP